MLKRFETSVKGEIINDLGYMIVCLVISVCISDIDYIKLFDYS